jgi:hypothetical protein
VRLVQGDTALNFKKGGRVEVGTWMSKDFPITLHMELNAWRAYLRMDEDELRELARRLTHFCEEGSWEINEE